jgi:hypothetical protein
MKKTSKSPPNKVEIPESLTNKKQLDLKNLKINIALANQKSFDIYSKYTNYNYNVKTNHNPNPKPTFSVFDIVNKQKTEENKSNEENLEAIEEKKQEHQKQEHQKQEHQKQEHQKQDIQIFQKKIKKTGLFIIGCFCIFLASFNFYRNFKSFNNSRK